MSEKNKINRLEEISTDIRLFVKTVPSEIYK